MLDLFFNDDKKPIIFREIGLTMFAYIGNSTNTTTATNTKMVMSARAELFLVLNLALKAVRNFLRASGVVP